MSDDVRLDDLDPLLQVVARQGLLEVATLNFDNIVEVFGRLRGIPINTGLDPQSGYSPARGYEFGFGAAGINLMKLHGSLAWSAHDALPSCFVLARGRPPDYSMMMHAQPAVLFGTENKLTAEGPYLRLLLRFQEVLATADRLTVVGYSFRDSHVNEQIATFATGSRHRRIRVIDLAPPRKNGFVEWLLAAHSERCFLITASAGVGLVACNSHL